MISARTPPARQRHTRGRRWDYVVSGFAFVLLVAAAFGPSLVNPAHRRAPLNLLVAIHGVVFTTWLLLFLTQAALIARSRIALHRRLGAVSVAVAILMVGTGYQTVIALTRRGYDLSGDLHLSDALMNAVFPLGGLLTFATLVAAGLWYRRHPETHKRLMLLSTVGMMMPASVAHLVGHNIPDMPAILPVLLGILFLAPAVYDRIRFGRFHRITLWGGSLLVLWGNVRAVIIGPSAERKRFVSWLIS